MRSLFPELDSPHPVPPTPRDVGQSNAEACAEKAAAADWDREGAEAFALKFLREHGPCGGEVIVDAAKEAGFVPHDDRAFGVVFAALARRGEIMCVGFGTRQKGHGTAGMRLWEACKK